MILSVDDGDILIPAGTLRAGQVLRVTARGVVTAPPPMTEYEQLCEGRARIRAALQLIDIVLELAGTFGVKRIERPNAKLLLADLDGRIARLERPVCSACGWPWDDDADTCESCQEPHAPDGRAVRTSEAERQRESRGLPRRSTCGSG
jgi:hypothetical protein